MIELQHVSAGYGAQDVVRDVSFAAPNGQLTALIGPNGSGKTTLLRAMTRTLPCRSGNILLDDRSIASYGRKEFARTCLLYTSNNQQRIKERNIHLPEDTFQTGSAGREASFFQKLLEIRPGRIFYNAKRAQRDSVGVVLHADNFVLEINVDDRT